MNNNTDAKVFQQKVEETLRLHGVTYKSFSDHIKLVCPSCEKRWAYIYPVHGENSQIICNHENRCGYKKRIKEVYPEEFPPRTSSNFTSVKKSFLKHGIDPSFLVREKIIDNPDRPEILIGNHSGLIIKKYLLWDKDKNKHKWYVSKGFQNNIADFYHPFETSITKEETKDILYIFDGEWDMLKAIEDGLIAVSSITGCSVLPSHKKTLEKFSKFKEIRICYDSSIKEKRLGIKLADHLKKKFPKKKISIIDLPFSHDEDSKDYCDFRISRPFDEFIAILPKDHHLKEKKVFLSKIKTKGKEYIICSDGITLKEEITEKETQSTFIKESLICKDPVIITGRLQDINTQHALAILEWKNIKIKVSQETFWTKNLDKLSRKGLRIFSHNAKEMADYFSASIESIDEIKEFTWRNGWYDDSFIVGSRKFNPDLSVSEIERTDENIKLEESGNKDTWKKVLIKFSEKDPQYQLVFGANTMSPMIQFLGIHSFVVHLWGESSGGKSFCQELCCSFWGSPETTSRQWKGTKVSHELYFGEMQNITSFLDDSQQAGNSSIIEETIYTYGNNKSKGRGTVSSETESGVALQKQNTWKAIMFSTGEEKATESRKGGLSGRVIEVRRVAPKLNSIDITNARITISENYGFGASEIIKYIISNKIDIKKEYYLAHEKLENFLSKTVESNIEARLIKNWAAILIGCKINNQIFGLPFDETLVMKEIKNSFNDMENKKPSDNLVQFMLELYTKNSKKFSNYGDKEPPESHEEWGVVKDDGQEKTIFFYSENLKSQMIASNFSWSATALLKEKGVLSTDEKGVQKRIRVRGTRVNTIALIVDKATKDKSESEESFFPDIEI